MTSEVQYGTMEDIMRPVVSVSSMRQTPSCQRALAFRYKLRKARSTQGNNLAIGSGVHIILANYYHHIITGNSLDQDALREKILASIKNTVEVGTPFQEILDEIYRITGGTLQKNKELDKEYDIDPLTIETRFKLEAGPVQIVGVIDLISTSKFGNTITDHKTASRTGASYYMDLALDPQAWLYPYAAKQHGFIPDCFGLNVFKKTKIPDVERFYIPLNWDRIEWAYENLVRHLERWDNLPDDPAEILKLPGDTTQCRKCIFRDVCNSEAEGDIKTALWILDTEFVTKSYEHFEPKKEEEK